MKNIKAIFFDIDGTLFENDHKCFTPSAIEALHQLKTKGIKLCLNSGRLLETAQKLGALDLIAWDGYIGANGRFIYDEQLRLISEKVYNKQQIMAILQIAEHHDLNVRFIGNHSFSTKEPDQYAIMTMEHFHVHAPANIHSWKGEIPKSIVVYAYPDFDWNVFQSIDGITCLPSYIASADMLLSNVTKLTGIHEMMNYWGIEGDTMAIGDSENDIDMIRGATIGIAMGNSDLSVQAVANYVCEPIEDQGIYKALQYYELL